MYNSPVFYKILSLAPFLLSPSLSGIAQEASGLSRMEDVYKKVERYSEVELGP